MNFLNRESRIVFQRQRDLDRLESPSIDTGRGGLGGYHACLPELLDFRDIKRVKRNCEICQNTDIHVCICLIYVHYFENIFRNCNL